MAPEALGLRTASTDAYKLLSARRPPEMRFSEPSADVLQHNEEANVSFFSGHSSEAFASATALCTTAVMRHDGTAGNITAVTYPLASATGWLRIAADKHYMSDVLTGTAVGALTAYAVPRLQRRVIGPVHSSPHKPGRFGIKPSRICVANLVARSSVD
jgi:membrane-associated phospholipid phosphatase